MQDRKWLATSWIIVEEISDLLTFQSTELVTRELHRSRALRPVGGRDREEIWIFFSIGRRRRAKTRAGARNLIIMQQRGQGLGMRCAINRYDHGAFGLEALIGFHPRGDFVLMVDLKDLNLVTTNTTLGIHQINVVMVSRAQERSDRLGRTGPVTLHSDDDFSRLHGRHLQGSGRNDTCRQQA